MRIWTIKRQNPFSLGGSTTRIISADVDVLGPYDLGKGYQGYVAVAPNGQQCICESETGAIIGFTLEEVQEDIKSANAEVVCKQIEDAHKTVARAEILSADHFWRLAIK